MSTLSEKLEQILKRITGRSISVSSEQSFKEELGIDYLPTFIYYKDGVPTYYMNSPATDGYYDTAGEERVAAYGEMTAKIDNFIQGCVNNDDSVNEELERDENTSVE